MPPRMFEAVCPACCACFWVNRRSLSCRACGNDLKTIGGAQRVVWARCVDCDAEILVTASDAAKIARGVDDVTTARRCNGCALRRWGNRRTPSEQ